MAASAEPPRAGAASVGLLAGGGRVATAEALVDQPVAERRLVSVLFADLVGFTALADARDPEAVRDLLTRYFDSAREIVDRYGGVVEKFIGDAVMAVWGTPVAHEDDAERSVRAALDLVDAVRALGTDSGLPGLALRAGVLTGEAAVTLGATDQGMVAGDPVNTASRLQAAAEPGTVLVGEATYRAASGAIVFEPAGDQTLKGKPVPVPAWRALRVVAKRGGAGRSESLEPPFVGRDEELRLLKDLFHTTSRERRPRLVSVIGHAGFGKSRLAWEFYKYIDGVLQVVYWHQGRSPAYGEGVTFWALGEMVRRRAGVAETDDERTTRDALTATLAQFVPDEGERRWIEPRLLQLLGVQDAPATDRDELFAAWRTFFERVAADGPVVMLFEDLHWADTGLLDFIEHLLEWARASPIYVVTLARPELLERRPNWGAGQRSFISLPLERLTDEQMQELLTGFVPGLPGSAVRGIVQRAEGVPLYAVEIVRMLLQQRRLEAEEGVYRPIGDLSHLEVPETLQSLIAARLDSLDHPDRALLQDAAVLGQSFTVSALATVSGVPTDDLEQRLRTLVRRDLLTIDRDPRSPERGQYVFVQSLIREVAYGTLAHRDRRRRHLAAARHFESLGDEELAGALATHYLAAYRAAPEGDEGRAVAAQARIALRAAADRAAALHSHDQALAYLEQARAVTDPGELAELMERIGAAAISASRYDEADTALNESVRLYRQAGDTSAAARATARLGVAMSWRGELDRAIETMEGALSSLAGIDRDASVIALEGSLARVYMLQERLQEALDLIERTVERAEQLDLVPEILDLLATRATGLHGRGRLREAVVVFRGVQELAGDHGLTAPAVRARVNLSFLLASADPRAGLETARAGLDAAGRLGNRSWLGLLLGNAVMSAFRLGEWDWALEAMQESLARPADFLSHADLVCSAAVVRALRGEPARDLVAGVESEVADLSDPQAVAIVAHANAWLALAEGNLADAITQATTAATAIGGTAPTYYGLAARAAAWAADLDQLNEIAGALRSLGVHGPAHHASLRTMEAATAALEGRRADAVSAYLDALRRWRDLGASFEVALCGLDFVTLVSPLDGDVEAALAEAREILERLGAVVLLERLDAAAKKPAPESLARPRQAKQPQATRVR